MAKQSFSSLFDDSPASPEPTKTSFSSLFSEQSQPELEKPDILGNIGRAFAMPTGTFGITPEAAKRVAVQTATTGAVQGAFAPIRALAAAAPYAPRALQFLTNLTQSGAVGAAVPTAEALASGEEMPSAEELLKEGALWAGMDAALSAAGGGFSFFRTVGKLSKETGLPKTEVLNRIWKGAQNYYGWKKPKIDPKTGADIISPKQIKQAAELAEKKPEVLDLLSSEYESPEKIASEILESQAPRAVQKADKLGISVPAPKLEGGASLVGRVDTEGPGAAVSKRTFKSDAQGGRAVETGVKSEASEERKKVSDLYKKAESDYVNINSIGDDTLITDLNSEIRSLEESLPSSAENSVLNALKKILEEYESGNHMSVAKLVKKSDSLSGMSNYELPFTGPKEILKKAAAALDRAAMRAIENEGGNPELLKIANRAFARWASKYANDDIQPFLERTINDPEALFKKATSSPGSYRSVRKALENYPKGSQIMSALNRRIAESMLGKFKAGEIGSKPYEEARRNLKALIGSKNTAKFVKAHRTSEEIKGISERLIEREKKQQKERLLALAKKIAEHKEKKPSYILDKLESREGIKQLRKELTSSQFESLKRAKLRSIFAGGRVDGEHTSKSLYDAISDEKNFELVSELIGDKEAKELLKVLLESYKKDAKKEKIFRMAKKAALYGTAGTIVPKIIRIIFS